MSFSVDDEDNLINIVAKHPVIYDLAHASYRNSFVKDNVWKDIGKELNRNSDDCKRKWKVIRDSYNRFKKNKKFGTGPFAKTAKGLRHSQLSFLDGVAQPGANIPESADSADDDNEIYFEEQEVPQDVGLSFSESSNDMQKNEDPTETATDEIDSKENIKMWKGRNENRRTFLQSITKKKDDDVDYFCRHIAEVLRNLPPVEKAKAKKHLSAVLSDYEIMAARQSSSLSYLQQ